MRRIMKHTAPMPTPKTIHKPEAQAGLGHTLIPRPSQTRRRPGTFALDATAIIVTDPLAEGIAAYLAEALAPVIGSRLCVQTGTAPRQTGLLELRLLSGLSGLGDEGYELSITPGAVRLQAHRPAGLFYACQTLRQLLPGEILSGKAAVPHAWMLPCGMIRDQPRFPWRGLMLDPARHFLPKAFILRQIDLMAEYKLNRLHLHLTDSQAWTLKIKRYPRLTPAACYTQQDIRDIVKYAAARQVMVIPEIEFPAHADATLTAYPELLCANHPGRADGPGPKEYCPGNEATYAFIDHVIAEVADLFTSPFIHVGGDEYFGDAWDKCPDCQRKIQQERLETEDTSKLQALFRRCQGSPKKYLLYRRMMRRVAQSVVARGRTPILWDDLAWRGDFPDNSVVMQWHYQGLHDWMQNVYTRVNPVVEAARAGHDAIAASASHLYFDYGDGAAMLRRVYDFEPVPQELSESQSRHMLGPHVCLWACPQEEVERMLYPRLLAMAEQGWTAKSQCRWSHFAPRLQRHYPRLASLGVQYASPDPTAPPKPGAMTRAWDIPRLVSRKKEWLVNDLVRESGSYEITFRLTAGQDAATMAVFWYEDGYAPVPLSPLRPGGQVYRITVSNFKPHSLYYLRVVFTGDGQTDCSGEFVLRKQSGTARRSRHVHAQ
ncbi:MAG: beta-N-acetylhexosaminidase [Phycisphaeraceae bacterium]|nr:beta-N-acetylhexosaminidase [Phycisphaeraceae bacterium]